MKKILGVKKHMFLKYLAVILIAVQFSFDSCVYLSSVVDYIKEYANNLENGETDPDKFLFRIQAISAAVQVFVSFIIGDIAAFLGSIKWVIVGLYFLSFVGNFLYSCGGAVSLNTLLGGRIICGAASASGAIVFSYITSIAQDRGIVFKLLSIYRTAAGIFMALAQLIVIFFGYCDFKIKGYRIVSYNAPTFASSFIILAVCLLLVVVLENPEVKVTNSENSLFSALKQFFRVERKKLISCLILLWSMFLSSFIMSEVVYFMPLFLTLHVNWDTKFQGIAFMVASIPGVAGSYFAPKLINVGCSCGRAKDDGLEESDTTGSETVEVKKKDSLYSGQVFLSIFALFVSLLGQAFMIGASEALKHKSMPPTNSGIFFSAGMSITLLGYNFLASSIPALFSMYIDPKLKVQLMPSIGAISGIGKLVAPIVLAALYGTRLGLSIAVGFGMILVAVSIPPLIWLRKKRC
ncbi:AAR_G0047690.mRNA.1.CDS.1 [Saccharomyces cerevisiae]|nr:AAR_G0047690.mRNA.1.CDS.1 [Saccharomyces cerevisiae]CAI6870694.1 AAR_G0047690.mRNA.1.CDS.1 [Saccharomyces cerevisiae]